MTDDHDDDTHDLRPTRRQTLGGTAGLIAAALGIDPSTAQEAIDATGGSLMALTEATNVAGDLYVGPDSAKGTVTPETGRVYKAVDTGAEYYADGSSWTKQPVDAPSVQTDQISGSARIGDTVYYDPDNTGPYVDGTDALADVPDGGVFVPREGVHDVAVEGRYIADRDVSIRGSGWHYDGSSGTYSGTVIANTGGDAVDNPPVEISPSTGVVHGGEYAGFAVRHEGNGSAVEVRDHIRATVANLSLDMNSAGQDGLSFAGSGYLNKAFAVESRNFTRYGGLVTGTGFAHDFFGCEFHSSGSNATALRTERQRTHFIGGELRADNGRIATFYNPGSSAVRGGYLRTTAESINEGVVIDGSSPFIGVCIDGLDTSGTTGFDVSFRNAGNCVYRANATSSAGGDIAEWTAASGNCGVVGPANALKRSVTVDASAFNAWMVAEGAAPDGLLGGLPTDANLPVWVQMATDHSGPAYWDGTNWNEYSSAASPFTP